MHFPKFKERTAITRLALLLLLILVIVIGAIPGYLSGQWSWQDVPKVTNVNHLKSLRKTGLTIPGWKTLEQAEVWIGGNQWSIQSIQQKDEDPTFLFLMPQDYYRNQPQLEWTDLKGNQQWKTDSSHQLQFSIKEGSSSVAHVEARFFRAWNNRTFAVVQWYAWSEGGHPALSQWFWLDQWAQLHRRRVPWIAVCLAIPISPLRDLESAQPMAKSLAQTVQAILDREFFSPQSNK